MTTAEMQTGAEHDPVAVILGTLLPGFVGPNLPTWVADYLQAGLAGVCLFGSNVESPAQLRELTGAILAANPRAIIAMDEEGGEVSRLFQHTGSPFPGNAVLGRLNDPELTAQVAREVGLSLRSAGVNYDLAPTVDVNSNPQNPVIGVRSFGAEPALVAEQASAWIAGLQSAGVAGCVKHFPGHGDTSADSHLALPTVHADAATLNIRELAPFRAAIAANVASVMTSHIVVPALLPPAEAGYPATFSRTILQKLLREEFKFSGVIISDALDMAGASGESTLGEAAVRALGAGVDLLCIGPDKTAADISQIITAITEAVESGKLDLRELAVSVRRNQSMCQALPPAPPHQVSTLDTRLIAQAFEISDRARRLLAQHPVRSYLSFETAANIAVGESPWGPWDSFWRPDAVLTADDAVEEWVNTVQLYGLVVVIGKDLHRFEWARQAIELLRAKCEVLIVEMGWPLPDFAYADIATFGASPIVGASLREVLGGHGAVRN